MMNLQEDIRRKGLMSEIVSRLTKMEREVRKLLSSGTVGNTTYLLPFASYNSLGSPITASPAFPFSATLPSFTIHPSVYSQAVYIGAANDALNYWTIELFDFGTSTVIASFSTASLAINTGHLLTTSSLGLTSLTQATHRYLYLRAVKTAGAPSNLNAHCPSLEYTLA